MDTLYHEQLTYHLDALAIYVPATELAAPATLAQSTFKLHLYPTVANFLLFIGEWGFLSYTKWF